MDLNVDSAAFTASDPKNAVLNNESMTIANVQSVLSFRTCRFGITEVFD